MKQLLNWIGGQWMPPDSAEWFDNSNPATGDTLSQVPDSDARDVDSAVRAAAHAFPEWSRTPARDRGKILRRVATLIESHADGLAHMESNDSGKPLSAAASVDIPRSALNFEFFADAVTQFSSEAHITDVSAVNYTRRDPLGVVGCISPWNLPLYLFTWKVAPALAAGNCVVAKPSEVTPETASALAALCQEAGMPPGVLNIVQGIGSKVGVALSSHPGIAAISFTGSTRTGADIAKVASPMFKKLSLEMGGKNANIIFADADFDEALDTALRAAFSNQGQICLCGSRILVERNLYPRFRDALVAKVRALRVGDPLDAKTDQGAVVSKSHFDKVLACIDTAKIEGGQILCGGSAVRLEGRCAKGLFIAPTLIEGLSSASRTNQEEIFGPVATLLSFDTEEEAIEIANGTSYGLASTLWTGNARRAHRVAAALKSGIVWVNTWMLRDLRTPFGGMKNSGVGREGGQEALRFFTEPKNICIGMGEFR